MPPEAMTLAAAASPLAPTAADAAGRLRAALIGAVAETLDAYAFVSATPWEGPPSALPPGGAVRCTLAFEGAAARGRIEVLVPRGLAVALACTLLGAEPDDPATVARADDACRELLNVTCGAVLAAGLTPAEVDATNMGLPALGPATADQWSAAATDPAAAALDADGFPVVARVLTDG